nr:transposase, MuDR, MULE transposase domain protein [Tanacetum cinerariifolium]
MKNLSEVFDAKVYVASISDACPPIPYKIGDKVLHFGHDEFSLVTGFSCGTLYYNGSSRSPFCARVFPRINQQKRKKVKADDLITVFNDDQLWSQLPDDDAVRWRTLMIEIQICGIWILETCPNSKIWWKKDPTKTPCGVAWSKLQSFSKHGYSMLFGLDSNPIAAPIPIVERSKIVGEDATIDEVPKLVDEVPTLVDVVAKDATVEKSELVDEVSIDREVATLKTILGLIDKAGGKVAVVDVVRKRFAAIEKFPEQSVNNDSENVMPIHNVDAKDGTVFHTNDAKIIFLLIKHGKLNYLDPEAYPSAMSQLSKISDLTSLDAVVDCLPVDNVIDVRLPNLNEPLYLDKEGKFEFGEGDDNQLSLDATKFEKEENNLDHYSLDDHTSSSGFDVDYEDEKVGNEDDREDDKVGDAMLENKENNADHSSCVHVTSDKCSIDAILVKGKKDDREDEKVSEAMLDTEENNVVKGKEDDCFEDKVGEAVLYKEENSVETYEEQMTDNVVELKRMRINEELIMPIAFAENDGEIDIEEWTEGTVTRIETDDEDRFKMVFIAFGVTIQSFLCFMRPLIIVDAAHLKGTYVGTNLLAVRIDGNNQIIPIAAVVSQESINALTRDVRKAPITKLMEYYRKLVQNRYCERRHKYEDALKDELTDWAAKKVNNRMLKSANWQVESIDQSKVYQVTGHRQVHTVDLIKCECTCRKWKLSGLPCGYVCAVSRVVSLTNCNRWALDSFTKSTLKATYD